MQKNIHTQKYICKYNPKSKKYDLLIHSWVIIILVLTPISANGMMFRPEYFGVDLWGGIESNIHPDWDTSAADHSWIGLMFKWGKYFSDPRYRIDFLPQIGLHRTEKDKIGKEFSKYGFSIGTDIWLLRDFQIPHTRSTFYVGAGLGLYTMLPSGDQAALGNSGLLGMFGGNLGFKFPLKSNYFLTLEGRVNHFSDILQSDSGRNHHGMVIGVTQVF